MIHKMIERFKITTYNFKVSKRTFSFDYQIERNGKVVEEQHYNSSHSRAPQTIKKYLEQGYATEIVLGIFGG